MLGVGTGVGFVPTHPARRKTTMGTISHRFVKTEPSRFN